MKLSIGQIVKVHEAFGAIQAAKLSGDGMAMVPAFAMMALACDDIVCAGWRGRFRRRPSRMSLHEFMRFMQDELPTISEALAREKPLIDMLNQVKTTET